LIFQVFSVRLCANSAFFVYQAVAVNYECSVYANVYEYNIIIACFYCFRNSNTGLLEKYWTHDQLLNNIMIYWWAGNITSSMRFYKEQFGEGVREASM